MLCGLPVAADAVAGLAGMVRAEGADDLADRLERALADHVKLLALSNGDRAIAQLARPPWRASAPAG